MNSQNPAILCVDDDDASLKLLEEILVPCGYQVVSAASGEDALRKIKSQTVDLVLLDIKMPGMDGFEVYRQIKEDQKLRDIPIIMITGLTSPEDRVRGIETGVEDYFSKPFHRAELLARIKSLLKVKKLNDERKRAEKQLQQTLGSLRKAVSATVQVMVSAVETRDPYTAGHQLRAAKLAQAIAAEMGFSVRSNWKNLLSPT